MKTTLRCFPGRRVAPLAIARTRYGASAPTRTATQRNARFLCVPRFPATTSLRMDVRWQSDFRFARRHPVKYVSMETPELTCRNSSVETESYRTGDGVLPADHVGGLINVGTKKFCDTSENGAAEPTEVDLTSDEKLSRLAKLYPHAHNCGKFLSCRERQLFSRMICEKFYKDEVQSAADPAMLYQASLEVHWVEEWVASRARVERWSEDGARRQVKRSLLERIDLHKPLSYIIGSQPFFGCDIHCEAPLLCPRPETEMWTHWLVYNHLARAERSTTATNVSSAASPIRILDVCCGTGCIGVALAKHLSTATVTALDILSEGVRVSRENAARNGIPPERYSAMESDMFSCFLDEQASALPGERADLSEDRPMGTVKDTYAGTYDVIVSNPPYVLPKQYADLPRTITHWESKTALVGDDYRESRQYLYFKELCVHGAKLLKPRDQRNAILRDAPNIVIEVGLQAHMVAELMEKSKLWQDVEVHLDYAQQERWISANSAH
ncbi:Methyltransferase domain/Ribosomal protein L11 methyltransferase (PrmA)/Methyltransferase small domain containing protein, putative [Leishmania lindenbergi]|uniref:Methyltransferase domain/Ribosomal protein L11 methyltransferase (PrmA) n=1 Tax=Leishmania lindenbergi TaxID=651832 RepID=A0AAW2ZU51_9TRYP